MKKVIIIFGILAGMILLSIGASYLVLQGMDTVNSTDSYLIIKNKSSLEDLAKQLEDKSIIKSKRIFLAYTKINGFNSSIKSSKLIIRPGTSYKELVSKFEKAQSDFSIVTIPEGFTLYQIGERLEKYTSIKKEDLLKVNISELASNSIVSTKPDVYFELEGFLYPDTYYVPVGASKKEVIDLMFSRFKRIFSDKYISRTKELGLDINDIIIIASLIEKEAANDEERNKIAGVIYNRLDKGMSLQIDASVIYAITKGKKAILRVTYNDLKTKEKYNTYLYKELPPGPIASPGKPSIEAALYPEKHDYLYYVANGGSHVFSKTYEEHLKNVRKYIK
jgi:UPF0755 protein